MLKLTLLHFLFLLFVMTAVTFLSDMLVTIIPIITTFEKEDTGRQVIYIIVLVKNNSKDEDILW